MTYINMTWKIKKFVKIEPKLRNPILIEGLPGIGNVGKVVADFMAEELKAVKYCEFLSYDLPNSVFVNEKNLVELPRIELYYVQLKGKKNDLLILLGDIQPLKESSSYEFCETVLNLAVDFGCKEIITLGGIGLGSIPEEPAVYITGNSKQIVEKYKSGTNANSKIFGIVGPILGVTGLMTGLASNYKINAACMLAETLNHPMFLGIRGSQKIIEILNKKLGTKVNTKKLDQEIEEAEKMMVRTEDLVQAAGKMIEGENNKTRYIG